jgi:predicted MFS family arabinose efflux permease/mannose-6-phosphate isomerase-like protein (cupin superfamily)
LTSLLVAPLTAHWDRKPLLIGLTGLMVFSGAVVALAPNAAVFMAGRALIGVAIGGFWSLSAATAMRLVPEHRVPRAGGAQRQRAGVRGGAAGQPARRLGGLARCLLLRGAGGPGHRRVADPELAGPARARPRGRTAIRWADAAAPVAIGMVAVSLFFMGQFTLFTYLRPFLETVTQVSPMTLSALLLGIGLAGLVGTGLIGRLLDEQLFRTLALIPALMAVIALALIGLGPSLPATAVLLVLWGLIATSAPVAWWTWLARTLPDEAEAGGGLMVAIVQLAITLGATVGGVLYDHRGHAATFGASAVVLVLAAGLARQAGRSRAQAQPRAGPVSRHSLLIGASLGHPSQHPTRRGTNRPGDRRGQPSLVRGPNRLVHRHGSRGSSVRGGGTGPGLWRPRDLRAGARTAWHTHPLGQTLIVTAGRGRVQWGGPVQDIRPGDVVTIPPGVKHWHGAGVTTAMSHIAIQESLDGQAVTWLEKVDAEADAPR